LVVASLIVSTSAVERLDPQMYRARHYSLLLRLVAAFYL